MADIGGACVSIDEVDDGFEKVVISRAVVLSFDARFQPDFEHYEFEFAGAEDL